MKNCVLAHATSSNKGDIITAAIAVATSDDFGCVVENSAINKPITPSVMIDSDKKEHLKVSLLKIKDIPVKESSDITLESISNKWDKFVTDVIEEKRFTLGPYIGSISLNDFEGNKLKVYLQDEEGKKSFGFNKDYLGKKTNEIFGKKMQFHFEDQPRTNSAGSVDQKSAPYVDLGKFPNDPLIDLIIKEFGAQEISG